MGWVKTSSRTLHGLCIYPCASWADKRGQNNAQSVLGLRLEPMKAQANLSKALEKVGPVWSASRWAAKEPGAVDRRSDDRSCHRKAEGNCTALNGRRLATEVY